MNYVECIPRLADLLETGLDSFADGSAIAEARKIMTNEKDDLQDCVEKVRAVEAIMRSVRGQIIEECAAVAQKWANNFKDDEGSQREQNICP